MQLTVQLVLINLNFSGSEAAVESVVNIAKSRYIKTSKHSETEKSVSEWSLQLQEQNDHWNIDIETTQNNK